MLTNCRKNEDYKYIGQIVDKTIDKRGFLTYTNFSYLV